MHSGDTITLILDYEVDGSPITENQFDEIEFCISTNRYLLSKGDIVWGITENAYVIPLSQKDTFALAGGNISYQLRVKKDGKVSASEIEYMTIKQTLSDEVI